MVKLKKIIIWLALVATVVQGVFLASRPVQAQENNLLAEIKDRGSLRYGTAPGYAPYEFTVLENGENKVVGLDIFLGQAIADELGVQLEIVPMEFDSLIPALESGSIDMIGSGLSATEERKKSGDFSIPYVKEPQAIVIRKGEEEQISDYQAFNQKHLKMGVMVGTLQENLVKTYMPEAEMVVLRSWADLISSLQAGNIDGVLMDTSVSGAYVAEHDNLAAVASGIEDEDTLVGVSLMTKKDQSDLVAVMDQVIGDSLASGQIDQWLEDAYQLIRDNQENTWLAYAPYFWDGLKMTLLVSAVSVLAGSILGVGLALARLSQLKILQGLASAYVAFIRGTPLMVQVLFAFLGLGGLFGWSPLVAGLIAISLNAGAYICEIIRGGINGVDAGQAESARSLGLGYWPTMKKVVFPQSLRAIWPALANEFITLIKESSLVSTIGIAELTFQTRAVTSLTYQGIIPLLIAMVIYFILTFTLGRLVALLEKRDQSKYRA
ncbi:amino acid ABC transporter [Aerococcus urinaehominis]|uniref:Amino acid ABC transporter n=1 Tax=Aerococcus urinaehominis TaxID=128944 RepID=A0A0X8FLA0_9LACT|nr:ABC transporter substrate-binding protein/permease [Aerococcus urinaehominis]AMB99406.1 amino acid ABC transporter [Aerococcus urinaehominis]SDM24131.1 amino acid ABC transporter substrate-binding protein, PAAT family (TC 3.A.1.3.-)/amino acid ABC transporter membrane protein, PAAT family (TC 3.A.1.3.-) [Aerococcus urinaehominis]